MFLLNTGEDIPGCMGTAVWDEVCLSHTRLQAARRQAGEGKKAPSCKEKNKTITDHSEAQQLLE